MEGRLVCNGGGETGTAVPELPDFESDGFDAAALESFAAARFLLALGSSVGAAAISMTVSGAILAPGILLEWRSKGRGVGGSSGGGDVRAWMCVGGAFGGIYVSSLIVLSSLLR